MYHANEFQREKPGVYAANVSIVGPETIESWIHFIPTVPFRIRDVTVSNGWDIEYVQVANVILCAFRKSPYPRVTPANRVTISLLPWMYDLEGQKVPSKMNHTRLVITGDELLK